MISSLGHFAGTKRRNAFVVSCTSFSLTKPNPEAKIVCPNAMTIACKPLLTCLFFLLTTVSASLRGIGGVAASNQRQRQLPSDIVIDFAGYAKGDSLSDLGQGVSVVAYKRQGSKTGPMVPATAMIFDSAHPTGGDPDLGTPNEDFGGPGVGNAGKRGKPRENSMAQGNVIIISEDDNASNPDDHMHGGTLLFSFATPVDLNEVGLLDNEEGTIFTATLESGGTTQSILGEGGDNSFEPINFDGSALVGVVQLNITLGGSGAVTHLYMTESSATTLIDPEDPSPSAAPTACCTITGYVYWDEDGNQLTNGAELCQNDHAVDIEAVTENCMGRVQLDLSGALSISNAAGQSPYMLTDGSDSLVFPIGEYTLTVTPDDGPDDLTETLTFSVVECALPTEPPGTTSSPTDSPTEEATTPTPRPLLPALPLILRRKTPLHKRLPLLPQPLLPAVPPILRRKQTWSLMTCRSKPLRLRLQPLPQRSSTTSFPVSTTTIALEPRRDREEVTR